MARKDSGDIEIVEEKISKDIGFNSIIMRHIDRINKLSSEISRDGASRDFYFAVEVLTADLIPYLENNPDFKNGLQTITTLEEIERNSDNTTKAKNDTLCSTACQKLSLIIRVLDKMNILFESTVSQIIGDDDIEE